MHKKFVINLTKIRGGCQSGRKVVTYDSKTDLPLSRLAYVTIRSEFNLVSMLQSLSHYYWKLGFDHFKESVFWKRYDFVPYKRVEYVMLIEG